MKDCSDLNLSHDSLARRFVKKGLPVEVRIAEREGVVQTLEGAMAYVAGDAIIIGAKGERWPVSRDYFMKTYTVIGDDNDVGAPIKGGESRAYIRKPTTVYALQLAEAFFVNKANGTLHGQKGDWLVQYSPGDLGVVAADIFALYYEPDLEEGCCDGG